MLPRLEAGERMALVSDAGLPGVSDPGARLVRAALEAGVPVTVLPGPSAVETALVASGLVGERYRSSAFCRGRAELASCGTSSRLAVAGGGVRVAAAAAGDAALARGRRPGRAVAVCRELTKRFEEVVRGTAAEVAERFAEAPKGEITLVIGPGRAPRPERRPRRSRRSPSSSRRGRRARSRPRSSPASPASRATGSTAALCKQI